MRTIAVHNDDNLPVKPLNLLDTEQLMKTLSIMHIVFVQTIYWVSRQREQEKS